MIQKESSDLVERGLRCLVHFDYPCDMRNRRARIVDGHYSLWERSSSLRFVTKEGDGGVEAEEILVLIGPLHSSKKLENLRSLRYLSE